jgi:hypothetical protein
MTRDQQAAEVRRLLCNLEQARNSTAQHVLDESPAKPEILAGLDSLIARARDYLARLGHPDAHAPPVVQAPGALQ